MQLFSVFLIEILILPPHSPKGDMNDQIRENHKIAHIRVSQKRKQALFEDEEMMLNCCISFLDFLVISVRVEKTILTC